MFGKIRTKTPGLKAECLRKAFDAVFEGNRCIPKNSIGIYTPDEIYRCKRAVCFAAAPLVLSKFDVYSNFKPFLDSIGSLARKTLVWGVCGQTPTRANELEEKKFLLCYKKEKKFIAAAIVDTDKKTADADSLTVTGMNGNERNINQVLDMMKAERYDFNKKKLLHQAMKRAARLSSGNLPKKVRKFSSESSDETDSDNYGEDCVVEEEVPHSDGDDDGEDDDDDDSCFVSPNAGTPTEAAQGVVAVHTPPEKKECSGEYNADTMHQPLTVSVDCDSQWMESEKTTISACPEPSSTCDLNKMYYDVLGHEICEQLKSPVLCFNSSEEQQDYADNPFLQSFYEMVASAKHANVPLF